MSTHENSDDAFGFSSVSNATREKIKRIRPSTSPEDTTIMARIDAVSDKAGFVSREGPQATHYFYRRARAERVEPRIPLNMRVPVSIGGAFQRFCEDNRYSYPEGLAEVMRRAGLPIK